MAIITISRQVGSFGTEIAEKLREDLGLNFLDKGVLEKELVSHYGIPEKDINRYDEKKPPFMDFTSEKDRYLHFMKTAMYNFARKGSCIMIGRGSQFLFREIPGTFNIKIIAPKELRLERVMQRFNCDHAMADQIMRHSDNDRNGFHRFFFDADWNDQSVYDLIINTRNLGVNTAVTMIKDEIESAKFMKTNNQTEQALADLCIKQEVITNIQYTELIQIQFMEVTVSNGVVTLNGAALLSEHIKESEEAARKVPGVKDVKNDLSLFRNVHV